MILENGPLGKKAKQASYLNLIPYAATGPLSEESMGSGD